MRQTRTAGDDDAQTSHTRHTDLVVRVDSPATLLAVIPHLLGFIPQSSLVVIGTGPPRDRLRVTLRYDLPDPPGIGVAADIAAHAVGVLSSQRLTAAVAVGYGSETLVTPLADAFRDALPRAGIELREFLRVGDLRYWSYVCRDEACCPAAGVPLDPDLHSSSALARAEVPVLADRAAVAARVASLGGIAAESMRQATRRAEQHVARLLAKVRKSARLGAARHMIGAEGLAAVGAMITRYRGGGRFASDYEIARITVALRDLRVRDDAWARMDPADADQHLRLWIDVVRRAQPGYVAAPAALLALASSCKRQVMARRDPGQPVSRSAASGAAASGHWRPRPGPGRAGPVVELVLAVLPDHEEDEKRVEQANLDLSAEWWTTSAAAAYLGWRVPRVPGIPPHPGRRGDGNVLSEVVVIAPARSAASATQRTPLAFVSFLLTSSRRATA